MTSSLRALGTLPVDAFSIGLDDAGNLYDMNNVPSTTGTGCGVLATGATLVRYPRGTLKADASYEVAPNTFWVGVSGQGEVAAFAETVQQDGTLAISADVWNPERRGGPPSYTIDTLTDVCGGWALAHDGSFYLPQIVNGVSSYAVYPPGSATPARAIAEKLVPFNQQANFCENYMTVGADGTLYVTEYTYFQPDPLAGLYIYYSDGRERFAATTADSNGPGPEGVDVDAAGDIYVANNNNAVFITSNGTVAEQSDTLHDVEVFSPGGRSVLRHIRGDFDPVDVGVTPDGVLFFGSYGIGGLPTPPVYGTFGVAARGTIASRVAPTSKRTSCFTTASRRRRRASGEMRQQQALGVHTAAAWDRYVRARFTHQRDQRAATRRGPQIWPHSVTNSQNSRSAGPRSRVKLSRLRHSA